MKLDRIDRKILAILQHDSAIPLARIASQIALSQTPCWKRIRKLHDLGFVEKKVALLNASAINVAVTVFLTVSTEHHTPNALETMRRAVADMPEIVSCFRMSGDVDYLLCIKVPDIAAYDGVYKRLIAQISLKNLHSRFALETLKNTTEIPLDYVEWAN